MGFSEAVRWWEEEQLRILVLTSAFLQYFLSSAGSLRKRCIPSWLRFLIWLAYLSSDAVAIYGLASLFNHPKTQEWASTHHSSAMLQLLWAPILLVHLGGQDSITAYNIEDNELWRRHVLTAVSQVAVAVYVFRRSWPEVSIILATGFPLFIIGILKCVFKPWDLKRVSINSLVDSSPSEEVRSLSSSQENYVQGATRYFQGLRQGLGIRIGLPVAAPEHDEVWKPYDLFVDLTPHHLIRLSRLIALVHDPTDKAHRLVRYGLSVTFDRLYTKEPLSKFNIDRCLCGFRQLPNSTSKLLGWIPLLRFLVTAGAFLILVVVPLLPINKENFQSSEQTDVNVTCILIFVTFSLEVLLPTVIFFMSTEKTERIDNAKGKWPDGVAQYNLMGYLARNKKHTKLRRLATMLVCKDYLDQFWCMKPSKSSCKITKLVHSYIAQAWTEHHIKDMGTYRAFNDNRGHWTLNQEGCGGTLDWSIERPFDESVLLWHLATDFCFHQLKVTPPSEETARRCRVMSNYMLYLLFVNPEMLMTGARRFLFREAYRQLKEMLKLIPQPAPDGAGVPSRHDESEFARKIAQNIQQATATVDSFGHNFRFLYDAWMLAQQLQNLLMDQDDAKMWNVIQGVWVEMLCFSAGRCRGYLHAKSLGKGGEYLSYIWLLMSYMGMETLAERMQRPKLKEEDARSNGGSSNGTTAAAASSLSIATGGSANGTTAAISVPAAAGGQGDSTTEASTFTPVMERGDADGSISSPVMTTYPSGDSRTGASLTTPSGDENV